MKKLKSKQLTAGFTLIETLVIAIIIGVLAAIATPSWIRFINQQRINTANDAILRAIQDTQREAKTRKLDYSISFRNIITPQGTVPQFNIYPDNPNINLTPSPPPNNWQNLNKDLDLKPGEVILGTNLRTNPNDRNKAITNDEYASSSNQTINFDHRGILHPITKPELGNQGLNNQGLIITVAIPQANNPLQPITSTVRCVKVKTLLGALQTESDDSC